MNINRIVSEFAPSLLYLCATAEPEYLLRRAFEQVKDNTCEQYEQEYYSKEQVESFEEDARDEGKQEIVNKLERIILDYADELTDSEILAAIRTEFEI